MTMLYERFKQTLGSALGVDRREAIDMTTSRANSAIATSRSRANSATQFVATGDVERVTENGKEWLKTPGVLAKEGVYTYPEPDGGIAREYLPDESLSSSADGWEQTPVLLDHPTDENDIATVIARGNGDDTPAHIGEVRSPDVDRESEAKLTGEVWLDMENSGRHDGAFDEIVTALEDRDGDGVVETSAAYQMNRANETGFHDGQQYERVQRPILPDHVAVFSPSSDKTGNCSVEAGCGVGRANADEAGEAFIASLDEYVSAEGVDDEKAASLGRRMIEAVGLDGVIGRGNADGDEQQSDGPAESGTGREDNIMQDTEKIDVLVEDHDLDRENMEPLEGTDCLENIYTKFEGGDAGGDDPEPEPSAGDGGDGQLSDAAANELSELRNELSEIRDEINSGKQEKRDRAAKVLADQKGIDADLVTVDSDEKADEILSSTQSSSMTGRANMAGAAGSFGASTGDGSDSDDYTAGRRGDDRFGGGD